MTADGKIEYDGSGNLYDEDGHLIKKLVNEISVDEDKKGEGRYVETGLARLLGISNEQAALLMANSEMNFSVAAGFDTLNTANWSWKNNGGNLFNMGKSISLEQINDMYDNIGADEKTVKRFMDRTYGSAIGMINKYGSYTNAVTGMLDKAYTADEIAKIRTNRVWLKYAMKNGVNTSLMAPGAEQSTAFGVETGLLDIVSSSVEGASFFSEIHTGVDYGSGGESVNTPGGIWQFEKQDKHRAFFKLFGSDIRMRAMHLDEEDIASLEIGSFFGTGMSSVKIMNYPSKSNGTGTGLHTHFDFTGIRLNGDTYDRGFLNPANLMPGKQWNYPYSYYDADENLLSGYPKNFYIH